MKKISAGLEQKVREQAKNRCGYCLVPQNIVSYKLEIEHLNPKGKGGSSEEENLWLACRQCNLFKTSKTEGFDNITSQNIRLFDPREQTWAEHFVWSDEQTEIIGKTPCGRATVLVLKMNNNFQTNARKFWKLTDVFPPND